MIKLEIEQTNNRNVEDFVFIQDIIKNDNGVIDITVSCERFKYWDISYSTGTYLTIMNSVDYVKGSEYHLDYEDAEKERDNEDLTFETFWFNIILDENDKDAHDEYDVIITPLKWEYEIKLVPRELISTYKGKELDWEEVVIIREGE
jgi:hypothetical protein